MRGLARLVLSSVLVAAAVVGRAAIGDEPVTLENAVDPGPNSADEPLLGEFSMEKALRFLDSASLTWQKKRGCSTCHTDYAYLMARPAASAAAPAHAAVRAFAEQLVEERWNEKGPRWDAEVVAAAAALALNDAATTRKLHPATRAALDRMWTLQREDGGFEWLKCEWPPMEIDDHYGATLAAIAAGAAPEDYRKTPAAQAGLEKLKKHLAANPAPAPHHRAMLLWASSYVDGLLDESARKSAIDELSKLQKADGGWNLATLGEWKRGDGKEQDRASSDGYATGFVAYVLRRAGLPAADPRLARAIAWLKAHQRQSGRWFTRSAFQDNHHFISHAGSAFAVLALKSCEP
jgi:squalene-hopene/tetraprenyl-beta-curcumene cyclase